mmetsp:Transcript_13261/g.38694  ORF Transcript_13261/g.38694 Transcript_13261/m.38694 type:complete len:293 (-) Transcript_13261:73-951(-)
MPVWDPGPTRRNCRWHCVDRGRVVLQLPRAQRLRRSRRSRPGDPAHLPPRLLARPGHGGAHQRGGPERAARRAARGGHGRAAPLGPGRPARPGPGERAARRLGGQALALGLRRREPAPRRPAPRPRLVRGLRRAGPGGRAAAGRGGAPLHARAAARPAHGRRAAVRPARPRPRRRRRARGPLRVQRPRGGPRRLGRRGRCVGAGPRPRPGAGDGGAEGAGRADDGPAVCRRDPHARAPRVPLRLRSRSCLTLFRRALSRHGFSTSTDGPCFLRSRFIVALTAVQELVEHKAC